jgi:CheY-like chemotaxis protein
MTDRNTVADLSNLCALVVEDNEHMRALLRAVLSAIGIHKLIECHDGEEALRELNQFRPDFIISDLSMLPMDGLTFTRAVRRRVSQHEAFLPIIMITGHTELRRIQAARDAGVTEILAKPLTTAGLLHRISEIIMRPRAFVRCESYFGPCRRRRNDPDYAGPWRREADGEFEVELPPRKAKAS